MNHKLTCAVCGGTFYSQRRNTPVCSETCRHKYKKNEKGGNGKEQYLSHANLKKKITYRRDQCGRKGRWHDIRQICGHEIRRKEPDIKSEDRNDKRTVKRGFRKT